MILVCKQQFIFRPVPVTAAEKRPPSQWDRGRKIRGTTSNSALPHENALTVSGNTSRCVGRTRPPLLEVSGGPLREVFGRLFLSPFTSRGLSERKRALTSSHHSVYRPILAKVGAFVKRKPTFPDNEKLVFVDYTLSLRTSALKWCGNPPVERNQVTITAKNRGVSHVLGTFRYISHLSGGLPRPVCALVSQ